MLMECLLASSSTLFLISNVYCDWKTDRYNHYNIIHSKSRSSEDIDYFANQLSNEQNFENILENILIPRAVGSHGHKKVQEYIASFMRELEWTVELQSFEETTPHGVKNFTNIIATLNPNAPRRLLLACHYDSKINPSGFLGATDSAVPCSQIMNIAFTLQHNLKDHDKKNSELTLQCIFFDGEEAFEEWNNRDSIYGARKLASHWRQSDFRFNGSLGNELNRIDIFVLLDLIGEKNPTFLSYKDSTQRWFSSLSQLESQLNALGSFGSSHTHKMFLDVPGPNGIQDDHLPFEAEGVPILHLITYPFPKTWHTLNDNKENLDMKTIHNINKILRVFVAQYLELK